MSLSVSNPRREGYDAYERWRLEDFPEDKEPLNPYIHGTEQYTLWEEGYDEASAENNW